jgi:hypothetical protein
MLQHLLPFLLPVDVDYSVIPGPFLGHFILSPATTLDAYPVFLCISNGIDFCVLAQMDSAFSG